MAQCENLIQQKENEIIHLKRNLSRCDPVFIIILSEANQSPMHNMCSLVDLDYYLGLGSSVCVFVIIITQRRVFTMNSSMCVGVRRSEGRLSAPVRS